MKIQTGRGTIPLITLVGIWSISALNALPGLAVSPILGQLSVIFPKSSELSIQMLTSLPSLLIIPFIILSGKLTERVNNIRLLQVGLVIFTISGVLYLFSTKMWQLILVSAILGAGSGLIVPLSTGLISRYFIGKYRVKQFGLSSAITNITLVIATIITGYLAEVDWHLPFLVYLLPIVSIVLSFYLNIDDIPKIKETPASSPGLSKDNKYEGVTYYGPNGLDVRHLVQLMLLYGLATYLVIIISFNLPFLMEEYHFTSGNSGIMISLFFLAIMVPGLLMNRIISVLDRYTMFCSLMSIAMGLFLICITRMEWTIGLGCIFAGLGYGVIQPFVYAKTTRTAIEKKVTLALAFVMAMNYLAILTCPFIINLAKDIFRADTQQFAFIFNMILALLAAIPAFVKKDAFLFDETVQ